MVFFRLFLVFIVLIVVIPPAGVARTGPVNSDVTPRILVLDGSNVHNAGRISLHVTNWGEFGSWPLSTQPFESAPSFRWPDANGAEYLFAAGLWVGALRNGVPAVSTSTFEREMRPTPDPIDIIYHSSEGAPGGRRLPYILDRDDDGDGMIDEEALNGRDDDGDGQIDEDYAAASDQMFSCEFFDNDPIAKTLYPQHNALNIRVRQESYAWNEPRFDDFIGIKYTIRNIGTDVLEDVYVGMFVDADIGHRDNDSYWQDDAAGSYQFPVVCTDLGPVNPRVGYMYDPDRDGGASPGYISVQFVGHPTDPTGQIAPTDIGHTSFHAFDGDALFENGGQPTNDFERYEVMSDGLIQRDRLIPRDYSILISVGPFVELLPGEEITVHVALAIGGNFDGMRYNSFNAVHAYRGEWFNADGIILTGIGGRETPVYGPAYDVVLDPCETPPPVVPYVPPGTYVMVNTDCATEAFYMSECPNQDSTLTMTGVGGKETQQHWYVEQSALPVLVQRFEAEAAGDHVRLSWDVFADEPVSGYRVYRADGASPMRVISGGLLPTAVTGYEDYAVSPQTEYVYMLGVVLPNGSELSSVSQRVQLDRPGLSLAQNHPNPFNPKTTISFTVPTAGHVTLAIYDVGGKRIRTLIDGGVPAGATEVEWNGRDAHGTTVGTGVYLYRLKTEHGVVSRKMVLLK